MEEVAEKLISIDEAIKLKESEVIALEKEIAKQNKVLDAKETELEGLNLMHKENSELLDGFKKNKCQIDNSQKTVKHFRKEAIIYFIATIFACIPIFIIFGVLLHIESFTKPKSWIVAIIADAMTNLHYYHLKTRDINKLVETTNMDLLINDINDGEKKNENLERQQELKEAEVREAYEKLGDFICSKKAKKSVIEKLKFMQGALIEKIEISILRTDAEERTLKDQILSEEWPELSLERKYKNQGGMAN